MKKILMIFVLVLATAALTLGQTVQIRGTITSADDGLGIPGVMVSVKGTTVGVMSDLDGTYTLNVPSGSNTLVFSYVGMKKQEIDITGKTIVDVVMEQDMQTVGEVVVLGYATRNKNELTGSSIQVSTESLKNVPVVSVDQALQGKVPGVTISASSGTPGSVQDIRIRGVGSITAGNDPLIIIDGVPVVNSNFSGSSASSSLSALAAINNNDIATLTVLKDASATAAYGARGSNGVIVITTKKGMSGKATFEFSASRGFQNNAVTGPKALTGAQKSELFCESVYNTYGTAYGFTEDEAYDFATGYELDDGMLAAWDGKEVSWSDAVTNKDAVVTNINLSARGGDKTSSFYASIGYNKTEGTVIGSDLKRLNGSLNYKRNLAENIIFSSNNNVSNTFQHSLLEQSSYFANPNLTRYFMNPWDHPYNADGSFNTSLHSSVYNTLYLAAHDLSINDLTRAISNNSVEWEIVKNLKFKSLLGLDYNIADYRSFENSVYGNSAPEGGMAEESTARNFNYVAQNSLDYTININDHNIGLKGLVEFQKNKYSYLYAYGENIPINGGTYVANTSANRDASSSFEDWRNLSYLGMANYNYKGKYIADVTYRKEGSSRFDEDTRFGTFWSVGAAWNIYEESFLKDIKFISNLRIRGSYGLSGSSSVGINEYQHLLSYNTAYANNGAVYPSQYGYPGLTWEKNNTLDVGLDFGFFEERITGSVGYFMKHTFDLLQDVPFSRTQGYTYVTQNIGAVDNKGIEAVLTVQVVKSKDFNVTVTGNIATVKNEVTELALDVNGDYLPITSGVRRTEVGQPINAWYMRTWAGVNPDNGRPQWYLEGKSGDVTSTYSAAGVSFQGESAMPTYSGGLDLHVDYKGIFVNANLYFSGGNKVFEDWSFYTRHSGYYSLLLYNGVESLMDRWQEAGDVTDQPRLLYNGTGDYSSSASSRFLYDGDFMRLKDVTIGYSLPESIVSKVHLSDVTLFAKGTNMFTWVKDDRLKWDPEVRADGYTRLTTPPVKSIVFGLNLKF